METSEQVHELAGKAIELVKRYEHDEAVELIAKAIEGKGGPLAPRLAIAQARAFVGLERFHVAGDVLAPLASDASLAPRDLADAKQLYARVLLRTWADLDQVIDMAREAALHAARLGADGHEALVFARGDAAVAFGRKRAKGCAQRELDEARALAGDEPRLLAFQASVHLDFDERAEANALYERITSMGEHGKRLGLLGQAYVARLMGEFERAHALLDALGEPGRCDLAPRHERARLLIGERRWSEGADAWARCIAASPLGDSVRWMRGERATALFHAGRRDEAVALYRQIAGEPSEDRTAVAARRTLKRLDAAAVQGAKRNDLQPFPSVAQLRDHCGPACCELYLEFLGIPADQVEIARKIKLPGSGTYPYAMREFMNEAGLYTRRVEATLETIRKCIDLRVPLILEEEYSTSRHVAVCIGYDDERGVVLVQDPMTHELRETPYEALPRLLATSNDGALIAVQNKPERIAELDAAGITQAEYIVVHDAAAKAEFEKRYDDALTAVDQCLAMRPDYELAWMTKFYLLRRKAEEKSWGAPKFKKAMEALLDDIQARFPDDEWPQQLIGYKAYNGGDYSLALRAFEKARDRDDGDGNNWSMIADCLIALGRNDQASFPLYQALRRLPFHVRAGENLADLLEKRGDTGRARALNDAAKDQSPDNPFNHEVDGRLQIRRRDFEAALACFERAVKVDPNRGYAHIQVAKMLAELGRIDEAAERMQARITLAPGDVTLRVDLADMLYRRGRPEKAIEVCDQIRETDPKNASSYAIRGASLALLGRLDDAIGELKKALELWPAYAWVHCELGKHLEKAGRLSEALTEYAAATGLASNAGNRFLLGRALFALGAERDGATHVRDASWDGYLDEEDLVRVAEILAKVDGTGAAKSHLDGIASRRKDALHPVRAQLRWHLDSNWWPYGAEPYFARLLEAAPEDPLSLVHRGKKLLERDLAQEEAGFALLRDAVQRLPRSRIGRLELGIALRERGRHAEALDVLGPLEGKLAALPVQRERVKALLELGRAEEATALAQKHAEDTTYPAHEALELEYLVRKDAGEWTRALELAEKLIRELGENEDDKRLDAWEEEKFLCLLKLGELERAEKFGEKQIGRAIDAALLAHVALYDAEQVALAERLVALALEKDPAEQLALRVRARLEELRDDDDAALATLAKMRQLDPEEHPAHEYAARILVGRAEVSRAELEQAAALAEEGLRLGPVCGWASAARGLVRAVRGDRAGALEDLERAWLRVHRTERLEGNEDVWAVRLALLGDAAGAMALREAFVGSKHLRSPNEQRALDRAFATLEV